MRILVTNDDGIEAPGLRALADALGVLGEVWCVAPDRERSAVSRAITMNRPLRARELGERRIAVDGTPIDCVYLALQHLLPGPADLVVSGINRGPNLGDDVNYSGTVAAAAEAAMAQRPAFAISLDARGSKGNYQPAARFAVALGRMIVERGMPQRSFLNVNVPDYGPGEPLRYAVTRLGRRCYPGEVEERFDPRGRPYYWIGGSGPGTCEDIPGSDGNALARRVVSITPMKTDETANDQLDRIGGWTIDGFEREA